MTLLISYDIHDDKLRSHFAKMLTRNGAIRLQYSVYEANNTDRILNNLRIQIKEEFAKKFSGEDSVIIFEINKLKTHKYGNAIHRDQDIVYF